MSGSGGAGGGGGAGAGGGASFGAWYANRRAEEAAAAAGGREPGEAGEDEEAGLLGSVMSSLPTSFSIEQLRANIPFSSGEGAEGGSGGSGVGGPTDLGYLDRLRKGMALMTVAVVFFVLAFFVGLPTLLLRPHKFAFCFTMGSVLSFCAVSVVQGWSNHFKMICTKERIPVSASYFASLAMTIFAVVVTRQYLLVVLCAGLQLVALSWYLMAFVPGGISALKMVCGGSMRVCSVVCKPCELLLKQLWKTLSE